MKIESGTQNSSLLLDITRNKAAATQAKAEQPQAKQSGAAFSVQLSAAVEKMKSPPEEDAIRRDKVASIRAQLAAGTYNISGKDVASKILNALKG
jgi:flagellar biosynthesis anti-sigma factor FlgM